MENLEQILMAPRRQQAVVADCVRMIEQFVAERGGIKGMAYKTGLKLVKASRPDIVERAVQRLFPEYLGALAPLHEQFRAQGGGDFAAFLQKNSASAVQALIELADRRVAGASPGVRKTYARFRDGAEAEVARLLPALGALIAKHLRA